MEPSITTAIPFAATQPDPRAATLQLIIMMILLFIIMYLIIIRPQQKKQKEHEALIRSLKPGDKVVTSSGIYGVILTLKEQTLTLRTGEAKIEILRSAVAQVVERKAELKDGSSS